VGFALQFASDISSTLGQHKVFLFISLFLKVEYETSVHAECWWSWC